MKGVSQILILLPVAMFLSCTPTSHCKKIKYYFKKVDTSKPYWVEGKYCIVLSKDTLVAGSNGLVRINIYNRVDGKKIQNGSAIFNGIMSLDFKDGFLETILPIGAYTLTVNAVESVPFSVKDLQVKSNTLIEINYFVGGSLQY